MLRSTPFVRLAWWFGRCAYTRRYDGLASEARRFRDQVEQVRILTPDHDLGQCLRGEHVVQVDRRNKKVVNEAIFRAECGFGPASLPDFLALTGDSADGVPGLADFGAKNAALLLGAYERLESIPTNPSQWKVKPRGALQLAATLAERREDALVYRQLATLIDTVPLEGSLETYDFLGQAAGASSAGATSSALAG
jgi:5'-3' exonuclease